MARRDAHGKLKLSLSPDSGPVQGVGASLRDARMRRGWTIEDCGQSLRIRAAVLTAMEAGHFERLPNGAYALGFVRSYADFLGLDRDEIVRRVKAEAAALNAKTELVFPTPISEGRLPSGLILLMSAVLAAGAYGIWYYHTSSDRVPIPRVAAVPEQAIAPAPPPASVAPAVAPAEAPALATPSVPEPTMPSPMPSLAPSPSTPVDAPSAPPQGIAAVPPAAPAPRPANPASAAAAAATPETAPGMPRQYGETTDGRIVIRATGDSWVQVRDRAGNIVFSRILRAGESYGAPGEDGYVLATGSAGMLDILVDGKKAPSIGRPGFVRKDVPLDADRLLAGTAVPPEVVRPATGSTTGPETAPAVAPAATPPAAPSNSADRPAGG